MFKINGTIVLTYYYNSEKEQITFFGIDGRSICDIAMGNEQWDELCARCSSTEEIMNELADLFGDPTKTNREWLLNLSVKEFARLLGYNLGAGLAQDDYVLAEFIGDCQVNGSEDITCLFCSHPLKNNAECQDVSAPSNVCVDGFKLWLDEEHKEV